MSTAALEIKRRHRLYQVENGPDSQEFAATNPSFTFRGIYENAHEYFNPDGGHQMKNTRKTGIMVATVPTGCQKGTVITTLDGDKIVVSIGEDFEGIPMLWLA